MDNNDKDGHGFYIQKLSKRIRYLADSNLIKNNITLEQVKILNYFERNGDNTVVYQKDVEKYLDIKRSSVTNILQNMEKSGLICRIVDEEDARNKKVILTEKGHMMSHIMAGYIKHLEEVLVQNMTEEEKDIFLSLIKKALHNIETFM